MSKQVPQIEWYTAQDDADWERLREPPLPDGKPRVTRRRRLKRSLWGLAVLLLTTVGGWWWHTNQAASPPATAGATAIAQ
jgi:hypothetical protein